MHPRRAARIAELIREEASQIILYQLRDPRIQAITVTKVDVSPDLHYAKIFYSVLGDEAQQRTVARGLDSSRGLIQSRIGKTLGLRESPIISFEYDTSIAKSIEMAKLLDQIASEREAKGIPAPADAAVAEAEDETSPADVAAPAAQAEGEPGPAPAGDEEEVAPEEVPDEDEDPDDDAVEWPKRKEDEADDWNDDEDEDEDEDDWDDLDDEEDEDEEDEEK